MSKRYTYSCVGYGVFSLLGEFYRVGRIEVFDREDLSGFAVHEGMYYLPFEVAAQMEDMFDKLETDFPLMLDLGSAEWCKDAVAERLGVPADKLNDADTKREYVRKQRQLRKDTGAT